jgi:hypothetical protein
MPVVDWEKEAPIKNDGLPVDIEQFWIGVLQHKAFKELATFVLTCPITPVNYSAVERIFSLVSSFKTEAINRMQLNLLVAIVKLRAEPLISSKCWKNSLHLQNVKKITSDKVYAVCSNHSSGEDSNDLELELFM